MAEEVNEKKRGIFSRLFGGKRSEEKPSPEEEVPPSQPEDTGASAESPISAAIPPVEAIEPAVEEALTPSQPETIQAPESPQPLETPPVDAENGKQSFFARLKQRLGRTKAGLVERVKQVISFHGKIDEELIEEIEIVLVQADVGIDTTTKIINQLRSNRTARHIEDPQGLIPLIKESILEIVSHDERIIKLQPTPPTVVLVIGVNGVGKTTTIGKLAKQYRDQGKKVMMVAGDTFRAAAVEQLDIWAERTGSAIVKQPMGSDPSAVCFDALSAANAGNYDIVLIDTAGRLHTKSNLMEELKKIDRVIKKVIPNAPHETLLILDATTGQNALSQAKIFGEAVRVTGLIMTKLDGTAKGGILIALRDLFDIPVLKIGIGEGVEDLRDFDPSLYVDALFEEDKA